MSLPPINATAASGMALPRRLNASWGRELWTCVVFAALGAYLLWYALCSKADTFHVLSAAVGCVIVWALAALLLYSTLPGKRYLDLTSQGFKLQYGFNETVYNWRDVQDFAVFRDRRMTFVVFNFAGGYAPATPKRQRASAYIKKLTGYDSSIGSARYDMSPEELAELLNKLRQRYAGTSVTTGSSGAQA
jgi:hypothetical protein